MRKKPKNSELEKFTVAMKDMLSIKPGDAKQVVKDAKNIRFDGYLAFNLFPQNTGLPWTVYVSLGPEGSTKSNARIWINHPSGLTAVAVVPEVKILGPRKVSAEQMEVLLRWVEINRDTIIKHWTWEIEWSEDAMRALKRL